VVRWRRERSTGRVEDRRGQGRGRVPIGAGGAVGGGFGILALILALIFGPEVLGGDGTSVGFEPFPEQPGQPGDGGLAGAPDPDAELVEYMAFLDGSVQDYWRAEFEAAGREYSDAPPLVVFDGFTETGCGAASSEIGPFYCPLDSRVYLDLDFFRELQSRFQAPGDFAQAYVIAHEYGHHVQNVLGINEQVRAAQQSNPDQANELSIRLELQADCLAGVWGAFAFSEDLLDPGDIEEGLAAASAVGDDRIQSQATGQISPETWTHGSSEQRVDWFQRGFDSGDINACDTFS
jgi:uncharacterized protein